ncbi:Heme-binding protein HMX1 [Pseudocercospora fuligena]|uniref:Heme-binding protein HMX1 n=1 Tax=Pseudocercospora fuligena TaxID=685502 RepID=A0A8H6VMH0_9PEZI|nr:Heme-binding protein HMX1 [Pseudocercospora fuligena]
MATSPDSSSISNRINLATRKQHTELNRLIIQRLPLALPPYQSNPLLFSKGIVPFARIFIIFEIEWDLLVRHVRKLDPADLSHDAEVRRWLANLRPEGLARSERLKNDIRHLRDIAGSGIYDTPAVREAWVKEIRARIRQNPEVLVAFAWVFYMATFAGGRWIRQQLANGGAEFWTGQPGVAGNLEKGEQSALLQLPGFTFLSFPGDEDGEDIKTAFKSRLAEAETLLTESEKTEILGVSEQIFDKCISLVNDLDRMVWRTQVVNRLMPVLGLLSILLVYLAMRYLLW